MGLGKYAIVPGTSKLPRQVYNILLEEVVGSEYFLKVTTNKKTYFASLEQILGTNDPTRILTMNYEKNVFQNRSGSKYHYLLIRVPHDTQERRPIAVCNILRLEIFVPNKESGKGHYQLLLEKHGYNSL